MNRATIEIVKHYKFEKMGNAIDLISQLIETYFGDVRKPGETAVPVNCEIKDLVITADKIVANVVMTGAQLTEFCRLQPNLK
jgi:hypothetical protein